MKMLRSAALSVLAALSFVLALAVTAAPAQAQATRTWVSGVGDDANPCSRTAPCKTFAGAISKTAAGGEINCLDPGAYGTVTITKSITIDCEDTQGSILASGTNGVNVNDSASGFPGSIRVILRGLSINGAGGGAQNASGNPGTGLVGVNFISGSSLTLDRVIIQNFNSGSAAGVRIAPTANAARLFIQNSVLVDNGTTGTGGGVSITPTGNSTVIASLSNVQLLNNANAGFRIDMTGNTSGLGVNATLTGNTISGSAVGVSLTQPVGTGAALAMILNSSITNNTQFGISASGGAARVRIGGSAITNNVIAATAPSGGVVFSYGNNQINGNGSDATFSPQPLS